MAAPRERPYPSTSFLVTIAGADPRTARSGFSEVVLPSGRIDVVAVRSAQDPAADRLLPGRTRYTPVVLRRGFSGSLDLYRWWDAARRARSDVRRDVTIALLSADHDQVAATWTLRRAWPTAYDVSGLDAQVTAVAIETLELAYEAFEIE